MGRWLLLGAAAGLTAACSGSDLGIGAGMVAQSFHRSVPGDPERDQFGVSEVRPASSPATLDPETEQKLRWDVSQICTIGYDVAEQQLEKAEENQQLVDWMLRCRPYRFRLF